ncbi:PAS and ANTAR domain-containing protein [Nocardia sp. NBC_00508]|uniref:PAS and ANTAR domain-containing protein n=1 Tax=Nocardia sp. NBC_00508 TaxID=2975992 RepID=UPI002E81CFCA|nr:PAS and ANTAR domain-containing protein [Nocardia sp. NBC_00508]WUD66813.1 PAS and ANTAR domain-containing protein [Nocardia sp. NBC_00508]
MTETGQCRQDPARSALGGCPDIGSFRFWFAEQRWAWSEDVAAMHGYSPGEAEPSTELVLGHQHPDDREQVAKTLADAIEAAAPFCSRHRIIDTSGATHDVIVIGDQLLDDQGAVVGTAGYYLDVTETLQDNRQEAVDDLLPDLIDARAVIEQAKGIVMFVYGVNADQAFRVLRWRSQETNIKIRMLAEQLVADIVAMGGALVQQRTRFDHLLLTLHDRAAPPDHISH